jgi:hypothetical protein
MALLLIGNPFPVILPASLETQNSGDAVDFYRASSTANHSTELAKIRKSALSLLHSGELERAFFPRVFATDGH